MKEGPGKLIEDGQLYIGEFSNNLKEGVGELLMATSVNVDDEFTKRRYVGEFHNDFMEGKGIMYIFNKDNVNIV